ILISLLSLHSHHHHTIAWFDIAFEQENLLPGSEDRPALADGDGDRGAKHGGLEVGVPVAIVPGVFVAVVPARREEAIEHAGEIVPQSRLELDGADGACASNHV